MYFRLAKVARGLSIGYRARARACGPGGLPFSVLSFDEIYLAAGIDARCYIRLRLARLVNVHSVSFHPRCNVSRLRSASAAAAYGSRICLRIIGRSI